MKKKTEALEFPSDPLANLRELQEMDNPVAQQNNQPVNEFVNKLNNKQDDGLTNNLIEEERLSINPFPVSPPAGAAVDKQPLPDPLRMAILDMLEKPYTAGGKQPRELVAGRVRTEIVERFNLACTLLKKDKQDVLDKAMEQFLAQLVRDGGEVDW